MEVEKKVPCFVCKDLKSFLERNSFFFFLNSLKKKRILFIYGCAGSSMLSRIFSAYGEWGLLSSCNALVYHCGGFSCCRAQVPGCMGFSSCCM